MHAADAAERISHSSSTRRDPVADIAPSNTRRLDYRFLADHSKFSWTSAEIHSEFIAVCSYANEGQ
jgi:hypothetical protein